MKILFCRASGQNCLCSAPEHPLSCQSNPSSPSPPPPCFPHDGRSTTMAAERKQNIHLLFLDIPASVLSVCMRHSSGRWGAAVNAFVADVAPINSRSSATISVICPRWLCVSHPGWPREGLVLDEPPECVCYQFDAVRQRGDTCLCIAVRAKLLASCHLALHPYAK